MSHPYRVCESYTAARNNDVDRRSRERRVIYVIVADLIRAASLSRQSRATHNPIADVGAVAWPRSIARGQRNCSIALPEGNAQHRIRWQQWQGFVCFTRDQSDDVVQDDPVASDALAQRALVEYRYTRPQSARPKDDQQHTSALRSGRLLVIDVGARSSASIDGAKPRERKGVRHG